jgi:hypothetical protein
MGIGEVADFAANADLLPPFAAITATFRSVKSVAKAESRSY